MLVVPNIYYYYYRPPGVWDLILEQWNMIAGLYNLLFIMMGLLLLIVIVIIQRIGGFHWLLIGLMWLSQEFNFVNLEDKLKTKVFFLLMNFNLLMWQEEFTSDLNAFCYPHSVTL